MDHSKEGRDPVSSQNTRMCRMLRSREATMKFLQEIRMMDEDQEAAEVRAEAAAELERLRGRTPMRRREF